MKSDRKALVRTLSSNAASSVSNQRQLRVGEEIRHILAELFARADFRDPTLRGVNLTITEVHMSADLQQATVFLTRLGRKEVGSLLPALGRLAPFLRRHLSHKMRLRRIPELHFQSDKTFDYAGRIEELLSAPYVKRDLN